jgi:uncharacterized membrane protein YesL
MRDFFNIESPFMQLLTRVGDLIIVNALYLVCCVPIVTIGAATAALHKVAQAIVYDTDNGIFKTFFRAFRENFKQATALWLMMLFFAAAMGCNYMLIAGFVAGTLATVLKGALVVAIGLVLVMAAYMFPLMVRYTNTLRELATNALILAVVKLPRTVGLFLLSCMPLLILALSMETFLNTMVFWLAIGFGFTAYMSASLLKPVFAELETGNVQVMK